MALFATSILINVPWASDGFKLAHMAIFPSEPFLPKCNTFLLPYEQKFMLFSPHSVLLLRSALSSYSLIIPMSSLALTSSLQTVNCPLRSYIPNSLSTTFFGPPFTTQDLMLDCEWVKAHNDPPIHIMNKQTN